MDEQGDQERLCLLILEHDVTAGALFHCEEEMGQSSLILRRMGFCSGNSRIKVLVERRVVISIGVPFC